MPLDEVGLVVDNLDGLTSTFRHAPKDVNRAYRAELRTVAIPTQQTAQQLAVEEITRMTIPWSKFRIGVSAKLVYVAPRERGVKTRGRERFRRRQFGVLMAQRVTGPALHKQRGQIERDFEEMLDRLVTKWDHDGP